MARRVPRPERILSYAEGCPASAGLWIKKTSGPHGPSPPCEGRGTVQSTVVGASAAADTLQEPWTTVGRVVEIWNGKIGDPEAPVSVFPTEWKLDVRQGIRSFQDLMPPPPDKPGPPPLQGGLGFWPCLVLCTSIHRFSRSREGRPRRSRRDHIGCRRSWGGARGR